MIDTRSYNITPHPEGIPLEQARKLFLEAHKRARAGRPIEPGEPTDDGLAAEAAKFLRRLPADLADLDADTLAGCLEGARGLLRQLAALAGER